MVLWRKGLSSLMILTSMLIARLREELFYQLGLRQFGDFSRLKLEPSPSLHDLIGIAVDEEEISEETTLSKSEIVDVRAIILSSLLSRCSFVLVAYC